MHSTWPFVAGLALTVLISIVVVRCIRQPLERLLTELCGNQQRASFWTAFSSVTIAIVPVIFALSDDPDATSKVPVVLQIAEQLKWGLIGMVASVLTLGWMLARFIPRPKL